MYRILSVSSSNLIPPQKRNPNISPSSPHKRWIWQKNSDLQLVLKLVLWIPVVWDSNWELPIRIPMPFIFGDPKSPSKTTGPQTTKKNHKFETWTHPRVLQSFTFHDTPEEGPHNSSASEPRKEAKQFAASGNLDEKNYTPPKKNIEKRGSGGNMLSVQ